MLVKPRSRLKEIEGILITTVDNLGLGWVHLGSPGWVSQISISAAVYSFSCRWLERNSQEPNQTPQGQTPKSLRIKRLGVWRIL